MLWYIGKVQEKKVDFHVSTLFIWNILQFFKLYKQIIQTKIHISQNELSLISHYELSFGLRAFEMDNKFLYISEQAREKSDIDRKSSGKRFFKLVKDLSRT